MAHSGITVENSVYVKRSSLLDNSFNRYLSFLVLMTYPRFARTQISPVPIFYILPIIKFHQCNSVIVGLILNFTLCVHLKRKIMHICRVYFYFSWN